MLELISFIATALAVVLGRKAFVLGRRLRAAEAALKLEVAARLKAEAKASRIPDMGKKIVAARAATKTSSAALKLEVAARLKAEETARMYKRLLGASLALRYAEAGRNPANAADGGFLHPEVRVDFRADAAYVVTAFGTEVPTGQDLVARIGGTSVDVAAALTAEAAAIYKRGTTTP